MPSKKKVPSTSHVLPEIIDYAITDKRVLAKLAQKEKSIGKSLGKTGNTSKKHKH